MSHTVSRFTMCISSGIKHLAETQTMGLSAFTFFSVGLKPQDLGAATEGLQAV